MKLNSSLALRFGLAALLAFAAYEKPASAQAYYWDPSTTAAPGTGAGTAAIGSNGLIIAPATGTWDSSAFWTQSPTSTTAGSYTTFAAAGTTADVIFNTNPTTINTASTITVANPVSVNSLTISGGRWTFSGAGTITIGAGGLALSATPNSGVSYVNNAGAVTTSGGLTNIASTLSGDTAINNNVVLSASQTWTVDPSNGTNNLKVGGAGTTITGGAAATTLTLTNNTLGSGINLAGNLVDGAGSLSVVVNNTIVALTGTNMQLTDTAGTYTGSTTIQKGALAVTNLADTGLASSIGTGTASGASAINLGFTGTANATALLYNGTGASSTNRQINIANTLASTTTISSVNTTAGSAVTFSNATPFIYGGTAAQTIVLNGANVGANTISGSITNAGTGAVTVTKNGVGRWDLGGNNAFTGGLNVQAGTLNLLNTNSFSGGINITGGTLAVGPSGTLGSGTGNNITINGGNLLLGADTNVNATQSITIGASGGGVGVSYTPTATFPAISVTAGAPIVYGINYTGTGAIGGTVPGVNNLFQSTSATFLGSFSGGSGAGTYTGTSLQTGTGNNYRIGGGGGVLTVQNAIFTGAGNNLLVGGAGGGKVIIQSGETYGGTTTVQSGTLSYPDITALGTGTSAINLGSTGNVADLDYAGVGENISRVLNIASATGNVTLSNSGTGNINYTATPTFTAGLKTLTLGNTTDVNGGRLGTVGGTTSSITAASVNTAVGTDAVIKQGLTNSTWALTGGDTYTGRTTITGGVLQTPFGDLANSYINLAGSSGSNYGVLQTVGGGTITRLVSNTAAAANLQWSANSGFAAKGGNLILNFSNATPLLWGAGTGFGGAGTAAMVFGSSTSDSQVTLQNSFDWNTGSINFNHTIDVEGVAATQIGGTGGAAGNYGITGNAALISGVISSNQAGSLGNNGFVKTGTGTLVLSGANTYSGATIVTNGTLIAGGNALAGVGTAGVFGDGHTVGTAVSQRGVVLGGGNANGNDGTAATGGSPTLLIGGAYTVAVPVTIANIFTGGTYTVGGNTDNTATYAGAVTANQNFQVTQIATSGSNALNFTGGITSGGANTKTVTFNNVGAVSVNTVGITDGGGGKIAVTQGGAGTTTLAATNTYTGNTTVNAGILNVTGSTAAGSAVTVNGGTLNVTGTVAGSVAVNGFANLTGSGTVGAVTLAGDSVVNLQNGAINTLNTGALTLSAGLDSGVLNIDIGAGTTSDLINITGAATLANTFTVNVNTLAGATVGTTYTFAAASGGGLTLADFTAGSLTGILAGGGNSLSFGGGGSSVTVTVTAGGPSAATAYFNGNNSADLGDTTNSTADAAGTTPVGGTIGATTDVFISSNSGTTGANVLSPDLTTAPLTVHSVTLTGTGTPVTSGITLTGGAGNANALTIMGGGLTIQSGSGNSTFANNTALGANQTWTNTDSTNVFTHSGQITGTGSLTTAGAGTFAFTHTTGNTYSGGTTVGGTSTLRIANTSGSATGSGTLAVGSTATLRGQGIINASSFAIQGHVIVGTGISSDTTSQMTLTGTAASSFTNATLTFNLNSNNLTGNELNVGATNIAFSSTTLQLNIFGNGIIAPNTPFVLIAGTSGVNYTGLITTGPNNIITGGLTLSFADPTMQTFYGNGQSYLFLNGNNIDVEIVPEPSTWALMIGGFALLVIWQRRRSTKLS